MLRGIVLYNSATVLFVLTRVSNLIGNVEDELGEIGVPINQTYLCLKCVLNFKASGQFVKLVK